MSGGLKRKFSECGCKYKDRYDSIMELMATQDDSFIFCTECNSASMYYNNSGPPLVWSFCDSCEQWLCDYKECTKQHNDRSCSTYESDSSSSSSVESSSSGSSWTSE